MEFEEFRKRVETKKRTDPHLFCLENDTIAGLEQIAAFEETHRIRLPEKYKLFLSTYGGGYFGYANIYSLDPKGVFPVTNENRFQFPLTPGKCLYVSDNGCGDLYGFRIDPKGRCSERLFYRDHEDGAIYETEYTDTFEYLVAVGIENRSLS